MTSVSGPASDAGSEEKRVYSAHAQSGVGALVRDLRDGFAMGTIWRAFAWDEIQQRYRRSVLGIVWIVISYLLFVGAISLFFGGFSSYEGQQFTYHAAIGYVAFMFLIGNISDGCDVFISSSTWIKSTSLPYSIYVYKSIARSLFPFLLQMLAAAALLLVMGWRPTWLALMAVPAVLVYLVNGLWIQWLFGLVATRWRDFAHLVSAITRLLFFMTPILWVFEERRGAVRLVADLNPLTHFLEIFRAPLLGDPMPWRSYVIVFSWTMIGWGVTLFAASRMRRRLPFLV